MGVASRDNQGQGSGIGFVQRFALCQQNRVNMTLQVVDGNQRLAQRKGQRLGIGDAYQQRARQAGALGYGNCVEIRQADAGFVERGTDYRNNVAQVFPRGQFRNHPTIRRMDRDLRGHNARKYATPALHDRGGGLIAGALDGQNQAAARAEVIGACGFRK